MRKKVYILVPLVLIMSNLWGIPFMIFDSGEKIGNDCINQIIVAIQKKDKTKLSSLFSEQAIIDSPTFQNDVNYLFSFFNVKVRSFKKIRDCSHSSINQGEQKEQFNYWYLLKTTDENYLVFFVYNKNTETGTKDNGIYAIRIIKETDQSKYFTNWQDMCIPGIFNPER